MQTEEVVDKETTGRAADAEVAEDGPDEVVKEETSDAPVVNSSAKSIEEDKQEGNDEVDTCSRAKILREEGLPAKNKPVKRAISPLANPTAATAAAWGNREDYDSSDELEPFGTWELVKAEADVREDTEDEVVEIDQDNLEDYGVWAKVVKAQEGSTDEAEAQPELSDPGPAPVSPDQPDDLQVVAKADPTADAESGAQSGNAPGPPIPLLKMDGWIQEVAKASEL